MDHAPNSPSLVREIVDNLVSNALKYSRQGGVITLSCVPRDGGAIFSISDNGIGIPEKDQGAIFSHFFRASNVTKDDHSQVSTGIGLHLARQIAKRLGYTLTFESVENVGTTFFLAMPLES